ncbi:MAG: DNA-directed RNA polymerase subunit omega [Candidatus Schekmanbacteria bacterium RBG_13_48_7]|uniref:DNA-directed RNA polymerase subunit omega n=1 Tax=Candidatus Schekmanbacteria bacterium RBG_13_48_7 TaxID=1817878 RepID=A0A1F7RPZ3_9BACT|nr:MAG: DNA-directed RNA polymerase subunit omega [Candidatus Schekmanbacteria bacterium RBG_13_48_7]
MREKHHIFSFEDFDEQNLDSPYRLVIIASRRAKDIIRFAKAHGKILEMKPTEIALMEIADGIEHDYSVQAKPQKSEEEFQEQEA